MLTLMKLKFFDDLLMECNGTEAQPLSFTHPKSSLFVIIILTLRKSLANRKYTLYNKHLVKVFYCNETITTFDGTPS